MAIQSASIHACPARHGQRGSILLGVIVFSAMVMVMLAGMLSYNRHVLNSTNRRRAGDEAFYAAESGLARAISFVQTQGQGVQSPLFDVDEANACEPFGANPQKVDVNESDLSAGAGELISYYTKIYREIDAGVTRVFVESTGRSRTSGDNIYRRVRIEIVPGTFAHYVFFNTASLSTMDGNPRWLGGGEQFNGPVHSNRYLFNGLGADANNLLQFFSDVTIVRSDILYSGVNSNHVVYHGLKETNADYVELPDDLSELQTAAANGGIQLPQDDPYYAPNHDGDPDNDVPEPPDDFLGSHQIHNYEFSFQGDQVTVTNLFSGTSFTHSIDPGAFNGAIVVNEGNIFVNGVVDGKATLAAIGTPNSTPTSYAQGSNGNVIVNGNLVYAGHPADQLTAQNPDFTGVDDVVGLIATRNFVLDADCPPNTVLDAHLLLTGQSSPNPDVRNWGATTGNVPAATGQDGAFFIEDGIQNDLSRLWTAVNSADRLNDSTGADSGGWKFGNLYLNGGVVHFLRGQTKVQGVAGYDRIYSYDSRLNSNPPPYYPLTGDTFVVGWEEERHAGGDSFDF